MTELKYQFPIAVDNVMRTAWDACERKFLLAHIYNLRADEPSVHLVAGGAYAAGLEEARNEYFGKGNRDKANYLGKALLAAIHEWHNRYSTEDTMPDSPKSLANVLMAILYYFETYPLETEWLTPLTKSDGSPAVEFTFALPTDVKHPETGMPILYAGRFDQFVDFKGEAALEDDKTASQLGNQWLISWSLDSQITGYVWAAKNSGYPMLKTAIIRGVSFLKTKFGHAQAIEYRTTYEVEQWHWTLEENLKDMTARFKQGPDAFRKSLGQACKAYGGCPYVELCKRENWRDWIEPAFHVYVWDPLAVMEKK